MRAAGEVAAARRAERLEHRMPVLERADARRVAARPIDRRLQRRRQHIDVLRPGRARPERDEQPAALLDERASRRPSAAGTTTSFSTTTDARRRSSSDTASGCRTRRLEARRIADRQRARQIQRRAPVPPRSTTITRTGCAGETTKLKTLSAASASSPARTVPRMLAAPTVTGSNVTDAELVGFDVERLRLNRHGRRSRAPAGRR